VIAIDTNILVYAHRQDAQWHDVAYDRLTELAEGRTSWAIPWPCLHEFLAIVTHPRIFAPPTPADAAIDQVEAWLESPSLTLLSETEGYWRDLRTTLQEGRILGPQVHDARVAALCRLHGVRELWTVDRDFGRFPGLTARNPLVS
jgi:toxin-antitoxin system PIN domain toxin